jgi:uncharacterized membrane protein
MAAVLALGAVVIQFLQGENTQINLFAFLSPFIFIFIVMPLIALVAAALIYTRRARQSSAWQTCYTWQIKILYKLCQKYL